MWGPTIIGFGSYHYKYASGSFGVGISTINWIVSDGQGNEATAGTTVTVNSPLTASIPDVYAVSSSVDQANTLYIGYGPTSLQLMINYIGLT